MLPADAFLITGRTRRSKCTIGTAYCRILHDKLSTTVHQPDTHDSSSRSFPTNLTPRQSQKAPSMRLLMFDPQGDLVLTKDEPTPPAPYAMLSHTWDAGDEQVTFHDVLTSKRPASLSTSFSQTHTAHVSCFHVADTRRIDILLKIPKHSDMWNRTWLTSQDLSECALDSAPHEIPGTGLGSLGRGWGFGFGFVPVPKLRSAMATRGSVAQM